MRRVEEEMRKRERMEEERRKAMEEENAIKEAQLLVIVSRVNVFFSRGT